VRRALILLPLLVLLLGGQAEAHPLGNFSTNHLAEVKVSRDRVEVRYILDQAEVPTFQERGLSSAEILARKSDEVRRNLSLSVDGRPAQLRFQPGARLSFPRGQGGLELTRLELPLAAAVNDPERVQVRDRTFEGRAGWKAIVPIPGEGTAVRSSVPSSDPTNGLRTYPEGRLDAPFDQRSATLSIRPGPGTVIAPEVEGGPIATKARSEDGFASLFGDAAAGQGVLILLLLAAFGWGALHALSPGHGKAMVAAYLIGTRGTARHAVGLGATVTFAHTIGVFLLGAVTLLLSQYILPEDLYPWLNVLAGLLVVTIGLAVLRSRIRWAARSRHHRDHHHHGRDQSRDNRAHEADHSHGRDHHHNEHHHHHHDLPDRVSWKGLIGMGVAAGLIPCPSALVVLLGAIAQHQVALGLLLIVAFSLGLAATLTVLGLVVVYARRLTTRIPVPGRLAGALPALSAALIVGVGFVLTAQAVPQVA
jgi:nickel/cobalt exporter